MADPETKTDAKPKPAKTEKKTLMVTYRPQPGDPAETMWNGHKFSANVPRPVIDDGKEHGMIALAKGNMCFDVEGHDKKAASSADRPGAPKTPEAYRAYAVDWFKTVKTAKEMQTRWDDEEEMRDRAGVGTDDVEYLDKLFAPRLAELKKTDE